MKVKLNMKCLALSVFCVLLIVFLGGAVPSFAQMGGQGGGSGGGGQGGKPVDGMGWNGTWNDEWLRV